MQKGPLYKGSKLQKVVFLISSTELKELFARLQDLGPMYFFHTGALLDSREADTKLGPFITAYQTFYEGLQIGDASLVKQASKHLSRSLSMDMTTCICNEASKGKYLAKLLEPGVHVRPCKVSFSPEIKKLHINALGSDAFTFGLEVSYPQLIQKAGQEVENALLPPFKNGTLFKKLRQQLRAITRPVKFNLAGEVLFSELRTSESARWILDKMHAKWPNLIPQTTQSQ